MGMFYNKLMESAVEEVIQTPDDIGVDLDAIEKNIVGNDGCEAHRDEIDDAMEGVVGDPMEEAATIMYESEYNFNQIMKCIGIAELNEMAAGRDFVLEAGSENSESFWEKIRQMFVKMFEGITKAYDDVVNSIETNFGKDKAFVQKFYNEIKNGFENGEWSLPGYDFDALNKEYSPVNCNLEEGFNAATSNAMNWDKDNDPNLATSKIIKDVSKKDCADSAELRGELNKELFVEKKYSNSDANDKLLSTVIGIMNSDGDIKRLRDDYRKIKEQYKTLFKTLKEYKNSIKNEPHAKNSSDDASKYYNKFNSICTAYITAHRYEKNVQHMIFSAHLAACKKRRNQARALANAWYRAGSKKSNKKEEPAKKSVGESALLNINII